MIAIDVLSDEEGATEKTHTTNKPVREGTICSFVNTIGPSFRIEQNVRSEATTAQSLDKFV